MKDYQDTRSEIRTLIVYLETKFTQLKIADLISEETSVSFYAKDINLLKVLDNNRWSGKSKTQKLLTCLNGLKTVWTKYETAENNAVEVQISDEDKQALHQLIRVALATEFLVYKSIPNSDEGLLKLRQFLCEEGKAYKNIVKTCERVTNREWSIQEPLNPSYFDLLDFKIVKVRDNRVFIQTTEHWFLKWFSFKLKKYNYIYENTNEQLYIAEKRRNDWKIVSNIYSSPNATAPPTGRYTNHYLTSDFQVQEKPSDH